MHTQITAHVDVFGCLHELPVDVEYAYHPASVGLRDGGVPLEPNRPAHVEIIQTSLPLSEEQRAAVAFEIEERLI